MGKWEKIKKILLILKIAVIQPVFHWIVFNWQKFGYFSEQVMNIVLLTVMLLEKKY